MPPDKFQILNAPLDSGQNADPKIGKSEPNTLANQIAECAGTIVLFSSFGHADGGIPAASTPFLRFVGWSIQGVFMGQMSMSEMAGFFRRSNTSYRAGIDLLKILDQESNRGRQSYKLKIKRLSDQLGEGNTLAGALASHKGDFPQLVIATIDAGERGGRLEESFSRLAKHYEELIQFRRRLLTMMAWPLFELGFSILVLGLLIIILDWITRSNGADPIDWLGLGLSGTGYLILYIFCVLLGFGTIGFCVVGMFKGWFGTLPMAIARRLPVLGSVIVNMAMSRFAWTLGVAIDAGLSAMNSAQLALRSTQNFFYTRHENQVALAIRDGQEINEALRTTNEFPDDVVMYVQNGENSGEIPEMMDHLSRMCQERAESSLRTLAMIGFVLTFLFVAALIIAAIFFLFINFVLGPINDAASGRF